jgi:alpha-D-ribose 1-methylphosphonate 5-triphosphate synthase subunit PhnH
VDITIAELKESKFDFVYDSQRVFNSLMMSMAFPGTIHTFTQIFLSIPDRELHYILQPLLTLLDLDTSFAIYSGNKKLEQDVAAYVRINTQCPQKDLTNADFILCLEPELGKRFSELKTGTLTQPDHSARIFYLVDTITSMSSNGGRDLILSGPGINGTKVVYLSGIPGREIREWKKNRDHYPLGIDIYLVSRTGEIIGIPRSVRIEDKE